MAVPFHRTSKTKKRMRRTHFKLTISGLITCAQCGKLIRSHTVCPKCGYYGKKQIIVVDAQPTVTKVEKTVDAKAKKTKKAKAETVAK
jgi:large subunit ribosomal protein L32